MAHRSVTITLLGLAWVGLFANNGEAAPFDCQAAANPDREGDLCR